MRFLLIIILCVSWALAANATVDPDPDQVGIYFDLNAEEVCLEGVDIFSTFSVYLIITNPTAPEVLGINVWIRAEGSVMKLDTHWYATPWGLDWFQDGYHCLSYGFSEPVPFVGPHCPLARLNYLITGELGAAFFLAGWPSYIDGPGNVYPLGLSSGDEGLPVAEVNRECGVVPGSDSPWGSVKSLYR